MKKTDILVDGAFFIKRYKRLKRIKTLDPKNRKGLVHDVHQSFRTKR